MSGERSAVLEGATPGTGRGNRAATITWPVLDRAELLKLGGVALQLAVVVFLMIAFRIENTAFYYRVAPIAAVGFVVHHMLPMRYRLAFFAGL